MFVWNDAVFSYKEELNVHGHGCMNLEKYVGHLLNALFEKLCVISNKHMIRIKYICYLPPNTLLLTVHER